MKQILLCTDGSNYSEVCTHYAAWISKRLDWGITALHVSLLWKYEMPFISDLGGSLGAQPYQDLISQWQTIENQKAEVLKRAINEVLAADGISAQKITFKHQTGLLVDSVTEMESKIQDLSLIMLGKRGENVNFATGHLGSNMERVVRASSKPCMVTNRRYDTIKKMLFAYDGSSGARKGLDWLAVHASAFRDLELHIVGAADTSDQKADIDAALEEAKKLLMQGGWNPICKRLDGVAGDVIEAYAEKEDMNMMVMGAYGRSRIRQLIIGSTTTELMLRCKIPVLLFR